MSHLELDFWPKPNRFCPKIMDTSCQGQLAYSCRSAIIVLEIHAKPKLRARYVAHDEKVMCLSFCKKPLSLLLASGAEDGSVKIWDLQSGVKLMYSIQQDQAKIAAVEFMSGRTDKVYYLSKQNLWSVKLNEQFVKASKLWLKDEAVALASCPVNNAILAVGTKRGDIVLIDVYSNQRTHKLHNQSLEISSLSWHPSSSSQLLASSMDGSLTLWMIEDNNASKTVYEKGGYAKRERSKNWSVSVFHPTNPNLLIASGFGGIVLLYDISGDKPIKSPLQAKINSEAGKFIFSMVPNYHDPNILITFGFDDQIIFWDLSLKSSVFQYFSITSSIQCIDISQHNNVTLAIGCGDGSLKVWDSSMKDNPGKNHYKGIKGRINAVAWHPYREGTLAFSSDEGRIGILETVQGSKFPTYFSKRHNTNVYSLSWGPCKILDESDPESSGHPLYLYSCGSGQIIIHSLTSFSKPGVDFLSLVSPPKGKEEILESKKFEARWKPDYSLFAVGTEYGAVEIYDDRFCLIALLTVSDTKRIQTISWHPEYISLSSSQCSMHFWLAAGSFSADVLIFDLNEITDSKEEKPVSFTTPTRMLKNHIDVISEVAWSPHVLGRLVTASFDNTVQVWDVLSEQVLVSFTEHHSRVFTAKWSYTDPDIIYSGGEDCFLFRWRISEQNDVLCAPAKRERRNKKMKAVVTLEGGKNFSSEAPVTKEPMIEVPTAAAEFPKTDADLNGTTINGIQCETGDSKDGISAKPKDKENCSKKFGGAKIWRNKQRSKPKEIFTLRLLKEGENKKRLQTAKDAITLAGIMSQNSFDLDSNEEYLGLFAQDDLFHKALEAERQNFLEEQNYSVVSYIDLWKGNIKDNILECIEKGCLSDFQVSLSSTVSHAFWLEVSQKYAMQCVTEGQPEKASAYLLACGKVYEAINVLKDAMNFRDAYVLAKTRLHHSDPLIEEIQNLLVQKYVQENRMEMASICHLGFKEMQKAVAAITFKPDEFSYKSAAFMCHAIGGDKEAKMYVRKTFLMAMTRKNWTTARETLALYPDYKGLIVLVNMLEFICEKVLVERDEHGVVANSIYSPESFKKDVILWKSRRVNQQGFLQYLHDTFFSGFDTNCPTFETAVQEVKNCLEVKFSYNRVIEVLFSVTLNICMFFFSHLTSGGENTFDEPLSYLNSAFSIFPRDVNCTYVESLHQMFFPFDIAWNAQEKKIQVRAITSEKGGDLEAYLVSLSNEINNLNIFQTQQYMYNVSFMHDGMYFCETSKIEALTSSMSHPETLLGIFAAYLFPRVSEQLPKDECLFPCFENQSISLASESDLISESDEEQGSKSLPNEDTNVCGGELTANEGVSLHDIVLEQESELPGDESAPLHEIAPAQKSELPGDENAILQNDPAQESKMPAGENALISEGVTKQENVLISEGAAKQESELPSKENTSLFKSEAGLGSELSASEKVHHHESNNQKLDASSHFEASLLPQNGISDIAMSEMIHSYNASEAYKGEVGLSHLQCNDSAQPFLQLCKVFAACLCKDIFAMQHFLSISNKQLETLLLSKRLKKNGEKVSGEPGPDEKCEDSTAEKPSEENTSEADFGETVIRSEEEQQLFEKHNLFTSLLMLLKEKTECKFVPSCFPAVVRLMEFVSCVQKYVECPDVKQDLQAFGSQLKLWQSKFALPS